MQRIEVNGLVYEFEDDMALMSLLDESADHVYEGIVTEEALPNDPDSSPETSQALKGSQSDPSRLTLEQLREMDGEPVWVVEPNGYPPRWGLVYWCRKNKRNIVYVTINNGASICAETSMAAGVKIYRRKPEEGTNIGS